jgi:twitching motility protein PilT
MLGTPAIRNLIREAKTHQISTTMATGAAKGMKTLDQALAELVAQMAITRDQALAHSRVPAELERLLSSRTLYAA